MNERSKRSTGVRDDHAREHGREHVSKYETAQQRHVRGDVVAESHQKVLIEIHVTRYS